jgi:hypothetical protein
MVDCMTLVIRTTEERDVTFEEMEAISDAAEKILGCKVDVITSQEE